MPALLSSVPLPDPGVVLNSDASPYVYSQRAGNLRRIAAWGIDLAIAGVIATVLSKILGNPVQDPFIGPLFLYMVSSFAYATARDASSWQATLGKRLLGLRLTSISGRRVTLPRAASRNFMRMLFLMTSGLSYLPGLILPSRAALHDLLTSVRVVDVTASGSPAKRLSPAHPAIRLVAGCIAALLSVFSLLLIMFFAGGIAVQRMVVSDAVAELHPVMSATEAAYRSTGTYPTRAPGNGSNSDVLPGSALTVTFDPAKGTFVLTPSPRSGVKGRLAITLHPANHVETQSSEPAWTCRAQDGMSPLLPPAFCALRVFSERTAHNR